MQSHERIGVEPVSAHAVAAVDHHDADVGVLDQRVGERHPRGPGAHDEVVDLDLTPHEETQARPEIFSGTWSRAGENVCPRQESN